MGSKVEVLGAKALERKLKALPDRVQRKVVRQSVSAAATPIVKAARSKVKRQSGLLRKARNKRIKTYKDQARVVAIIGPRRDVKGEFEGKPRVPWRYAHLVEGGHVTDDGKHIPAQPFLRPAFEETQGQALGIMKTKLGDGVTREAMKA